MVTRPLGHSVFRVIIIIVPWSDRKKIEKDRKRQHKVTTLPPELRLFLIVATVAPVRSLPRCSLSVQILLRLSGEIEYSDRLDSSLNPLSPSHRDGRSSPKGGENPPRVELLSFPSSLVRRCIVSTHAESVSSAT